MSKPGIDIQPKPEGNHYVVIHRCYKDITDGKESTAAILSVLEYLAERTVLRSTTLNAVPDSIAIDGDCNYPIFNKLLDGMLKPTAVKNKLKYLDELGFISSTIQGGKRRKIIYNRKAIANALASLNYSSDPSENTQSKSDPSKSDDSTRQKVTTKDPLTRQKVTGTRQKVPPTIPITNQEETNQKTNQEISAFSGESDFILHADIAFMTNVERQELKFSSKRIQLDPWLIDNEKNRRLVRMDQASRCTVDPGFAEYLQRQLANTPHWKGKSDLTGNAAVSKLISSLYAAFDPNQAQAARVKYQGLWNKYKGPEQSQAVVSIQPSPENVHELIRREQSRLGTSIRLTGHWPQKTGKQTSHQLNGQEALGYLEYLRGLGQEVAHAS